MKMGCLDARSIRTDWKQNKMAFSARKGEIRPIPRARETGLCLHPSECSISLSVVAWACWCIPAKQSILPVNLQQSCQTCSAFTTDTSWPTGLNSSPHTLKISPVCWGDCQLSQLTSQLHRTKSKDSCAAMNETWMKIKRTTCRKPASNLCRVQDQWVFHDYNWMC